MLSQIRALPNPSYLALPPAQTRQAHPLTLHLSPTSTANIIISLVTPELPSSSPFAKLAPDAEVIVAPKLRPRLSRSGRTDSRSVASAGRSAGGKSGVNTDRTHSHKHEPPVFQPLFFRGLDRGTCVDWFDSEDPSTMNAGLTAWVDRDVVLSTYLRDIECVCVSVVQPAALKRPVDPQQHQKAKEQANFVVGKYASKVVAKIGAWDDAPNSHHAALSSLLCAVLGVEGLVGGIVRIEAAPAPVPTSSIKNLKIYPFAPSSTRQSEPVRFGGETKASREAAAEKIKAIYGYDDGIYRGLLHGPLTNGLVLPKSIAHFSEQSWSGGLLQFDPPGTFEMGNLPVTWSASQDANISVEIQHDVPNPYGVRRTGVIDINSLPLEAPLLVGIDELIQKLMSYLSHQTSVLLNGGLGSGKSAIACLLAIRQRREKLYHTTYFSCRKLVTDDTRISAIKETFNRLFMTASWGSRSGGRAIVILDDLDKLCPAETELQVGGENSRSRQVSELVCSMAHQYCSAESRIVLLLTAQSKDALNSIIIGAHVVRNIVDIKAPDKHTRRQVLQSIAHQSFLSQSTTTKKVGTSTLSGPDDEIPWMNGSPSYSRANPSNGKGGFAISPNLDFLDLAGQTDGYMPGDLELLISRARSEALVRYIQDYGANLAQNEPTIELGKKDFEQALKGFTPASLRNVTLQTSSITFDSIGGLQATRKILLETLQYPTTYAPIFAQCPLRLRSGLLLYGYPGCGKTLLASAVAGECGLNFISVKGPEILNKYIGASEQSVRDLFDRAEAARPCVLFFDEFDSIAPKRGHDSTGVTDRVVNQLLTQMDGAEGLSGVYVLAATSRPDLIDPALLRPGRLDKSLICDLPNEDDRLDILRALSKKLKISPEIINLRRPERTFAEVARRTEGYSGADLQAVIYNAHLEAIHDVLGEQKGSTSADGPRYKDQTALTERSRARELIQFRYGEKEEGEEAAERASSGTNRSKQIAEQAALVAKLDFIKASKRKEKQARHGQVNAALDEREGKNDKDVEVVIEWKHIEASLATTRRSISTDERRKLERVYTEFVVGRNGEMPSGQASVEVGGRSSLM